MKSKNHTVAVLMSVYDGDQLQYFKEAVDSVLEQTYPEVDLYIYADAVSKPELIDYIKILENNKKVFIKKGEFRKGLAFGLNMLLEEIKYKNYGYLARMDSDDISLKDRLQNQVDFLNSNIDIAVVGGNCIEISCDGKPLFQKKMPETHEEIIKSIIKRCPFIHPAVMFRGRIIQDIKYDNTLMNTQDYYLWVDLTAKGYKFHNLQEFLLKFRVSNDFYNRRGLNKIKNEMKSRFYAMRKLNNHSFSNYTFLIMLFFLRIAPVRIKKFCYMKMR